MIAHQDIQNEHTYKFYMDFVNFGFRNIGTVLLELLSGNVKADWKLCLNSNETL